MKNNKSLGQHWLKDRTILDEIASLAGDAPRCLEIGPGLGTLTSSLLRRFSEVIAVEFDENLAANLPKSFPGKNLTVINKDFLKFDLDSIPSPYVVAGNIPYYITSPIIFKLLSSDNLPDKIVLLIQKEVAERIIAGPGDHTVLSLSVQNCATVELGPIVEREYFTPPPKVDSAVIILTPKSHPEVDDSVIDIVKIGFSAPRKKLIANLSHGLNFSREALADFFTSSQWNPNARPADLSLKDWQLLADFIHKR